MLENGFTLIFPAPTVSTVTLDDRVNTGPFNISNRSGTNFNITGIPVVNLTMAGQADITATGVSIPHILADHLHFRPDR